MTERYETMGRLFQSSREMHEHVMLRWLSGGGQADLNNIITYLCQYSDDQDVASQINKAWKHGHHTPYDHDELTKAAAKFRKLYCDAYESPLPEFNPPLSRKDWLLLRDGLQAMSQPSLAPGRLPLEADRLEHVRRLYKRLCNELHRTMPDIITDGT